MRTLALAVLVLSASLSVVKGALAPELEAEITAAIESELRETGAPGGAVAIVREGEVVYLRAFGRTAG